MSVARATSFNGIQTHPLTPGPGVFDPGRRPTMREQLAMLNQALTAEVLRHAETRQALRDALRVVARPAQGPAMERPRAAMSSIVRRAAARKVAAAPLHARIDLGRGVTFDPDAWRLVSATGKVVRLSGNEGLLIRALLARPGQTVLYADIGEVVWDGGTPARDIGHMIRVLLCRVRARLQAVGAGGLLTTVRDVGLRLEVAS